MIKYKIVQADNFSQLLDMYYSYSRSASVYENPDKYVLLIITHQDSKRSEFNNSSSIFVASNGFSLHSAICPDMEHHNNSTLYVRGSSSSQDNRPSIIPINVIHKVIFAIEEYNEMTKNRMGSINYE